MTETKKLEHLTLIPDENLLALERTTEWLNELDKLRMYRESNLLRIEQNLKNMTNPSRNVVQLFDLRKNLFGYMLKEEKYEKSKSPKKYQFIDVWFFNSQLPLGEVLRIAQKDSISYLNREKGIDPILNISRGRIYYGLMIGLNSYANIDVFTKQSKSPKNYDCKMHCEKLDDLLRKLYP